MYTEKVSVHGKGTGPSGSYIYSWLPGSLEQEAQGLGALLDKMEDNDHIKLDSNHDIRI